MIHGFTAAYTKMRVNMMMIVNAFRQIGEEFCFPFAKWETVSPMAQLAIGSASLGRFSSVTASATKFLNASVAQLYICNVAWYVQCACQHSLALCFTIIIIDYHYRLHAQIYINLISNNKKYLYYKIKMFTNHMHGPFFILLFAFEVGLGILKIKCFILI